MKSDEIIKATLNIQGNSSTFQMPFVTENVKLHNVNDKLMTLELTSDDGLQKVLISFEKK